ncbi:unnamed protein product [Rhizophagus irregularis]|nr:unnamed protein product [Rhizophagus irregularis]
MYKGNKAELEIVGEENSRSVYYTIEALEELLCITEGKLYECGHWFRPESGAIRNCVAEGLRMKKNCIKT